MHNLLNSTKDIYEEMNGMRRYFKVDVEFTNNLQYINSFDLENFSTASENCHLIASAGRSFYVLLYSLLISLETD